MRWLVLPALALGALLAGCGKAPAQLEAGESLRFVREGKVLRTLTKGELSAAIRAETITEADPYYGRSKTFRALPLAAVLAQGFQGVELAQEELFVRARDGYAVPVTGALLLERGGYVAIEDVEVPGWEPIGPQRAHPGPFYVVWREPGQADERYPRVWQLAEFEVARFETLYPHVTPPGLPADAPAMQGLRLFREQCIRCHAVNREGGRVGPDLNVPQSIVEYRPEAQIRAYIVNPLQFRYGAMPAHPHLREADLDALLSYFHAMKDHKHDPERKAP